MSAIQTLIDLCRDNDSFQEMLSNYPEGRADFAAAQAEFASLLADLARFAGDNEQLLKALGVETVDAALTLCRLTAQAISYELVSTGSYWLSSITLEQRRGSYGTRWSIFWNRLALSKQLEWTQEPIMAQHLDDYYAQCRFESVEDAYAHWERYRQTPGGQIFIAIVQTPELPVDRGTP